MYFCQKFCMRYLICIFVLSLAACSSTPSDLTIDGTINTKDSVTIIRYVPDSNNQPRPYDTIVASKGVFSLKSSLDVPMLNFIMVEGYSGNFPFIAEKGYLTMTIDVNDLGKSSTRGSISNDSYMDYKAQTTAFSETLNQLTAEINEARQLNDNLLVEELQKKYTAQQAAIQAYEKKLVETENDSYLAALLLERMLANKSMSTALAKPIFESYSPRIQQTALGKSLLAKINAPVSPTAIGSQAPNFTAPTPEGAPLELQKNLGKKITILDFWASWCRPCRIENPNLVRTYNKLKDKGLHVVSVSLDRDKKRWVQAIKDDGLTWDHVSNLQYWRDPVAQLYKVSSIPATFILDENGVIIAKNLRGPQLEATLSQLIQQN